ncbi:hypothetical protein CAPTEDRAFT_221829 [Capitella teleta]|uniref:PDZ domain-containing protein n=1 Tax=Capitella teleta TaxID=283909 RepID=R7VLU8_CAPTE|nr:hypothetical protein CAPTEDRAFT_221829 [Capitella teleta]|eukprot:ELU18581.1 hypothetical protein CAPTEDRAFT_221829 [Capitella teleta]
MEVDVLKARVVRAHANMPWGFRLQGGTDGTPVSILRVTPGSPAHKLGLRMYDVITEIGDVSTDNMTSQEASELIGQYGDTIILTVERKAQGHVPCNPVVTPENPDDAKPKSYQTYDMSGSKPGPMRSSSTQGHVSETPASPVGVLPSPSVQAQEGAEWVPVGYFPNYGTPTPPASNPQKDSSKFYQTYDLTGKPSTPMPSTPQHNYTFRTAKSQPFQGHQRSPKTSVTHSPGSFSPVDYVDHNLANYTSQMRLDDGISNGREEISGQSKSFNVIKTLMENDAPHAGARGLPPPRSVTQENWMREQRERSTGSPRVKVFMPQQYNSPLGMYSPTNVVETFQSQAGNMMGDANGHSSVSDL